MSVDIKTKAYILRANQALYPYTIGYKALLPGVIFKPQHIVYYTCRAYANNNN